MNILFTADLHFTDNPRDEYRWGLLPWLAKMARQHKVDKVVLGGDITDAKDKHSAVLVNRLTQGLIDIANQTELHIYRGNHDCIDEGEPFFGFARGLKSRYSIHFITEPTRDGPLLFLPNTKNWKEEWSYLNFSEPEMIFAHATFDGCTSESGYKLVGIPPSTFRGARKVWSGDVHKQQMVGRNIEYVGAPYRIRFGDAFEPRVVLLEKYPDNTWFSKDFHYRCQGKHLIEIDNPATPRAAANQLANTQETGGLTIYEGDQVKVRVRLKRSAYPDWPAIKEAIIEEAKAAKLQLTGPELVAIEENQQKLSASAKDTPQDDGSPLDALRTWAEPKDLPTPLFDAGEAYLKAALDAPG